MLAVFIVLYCLSILCEVYEQVANTNKQQQSFYVH